MDYLRSCYITLMRFPRAGIVPIRWYWSTGLDFERETIYRSHDWIRDIKGMDSEYEDTGEYGEVWSAPRFYVKGEPPVSCPCVGPEGSDEAWMGLNDNTSPLYDPCVWGYEYNEEYSSAFDSWTFAHGIINE